MNHEGGHGLAALKTKNHEGGAGGGSWSPAPNQEPTPGRRCMWGGVVESDSTITTTKHDEKLLFSNNRVRAH